MRRAFVDTSAFYALADRSDRFHQDARGILERRGPTDEWITTDHVVVESWHLLRGRLGYTAALRFWDDLAAGLATVATLSSADMVRARAIAEAWLDQKFSLVDCTSFAFIERLGLSRALAYDAHFAAFRLGPGRRRRLTLGVD
jgi:predicted nucleic acid-binding protein